MVNLIGIPFDGKSSFLKGSASAPDAIRKEFLSPAYNPYSESLKEVYTLVRDCGNVRADSFEELGENIKSLNLTAEPSIFLGGDHSISYLTVRKLHQYHKRTFHILHFDAHADLYDQFEGDRFSHACPFARVMEEKLVLSLTQVGIRAMTPHQMEQAQRFDVQVFGMRRIADFNPGLLQGPLHISLDLDVFDPAFAPGVSHQEAGGISSRQLIDWLHQIKVPVIGADLVEYNPIRDKENITGALCAKLLKELVAIMG